jgi:hypothetical protein
MQHLIGTQTKLKEMQITILKLALMAQKKHEMEVGQLEAGVVGSVAVNMSAATTVVFTSPPAGAAGLSGRHVGGCSRRRLHVHGT